MQSWCVVRSLVIVLILLTLLGTRIIAPEMQRLLESPPPVVVATFPLKCLSSDQAASLLRPYLPRPKNPRWQAEDFDVIPGSFGIRAVTVRGPQKLIDDVPGIIAKFEREFATTCTP